MIVHANALAESTQTRGEGYTRATRKQTMYRSNDVNYETTDDEVDLIDPDAVHRETFVPKIVPLTPRHRLWRCYSPMAVSFKK